MKTESKKEVLKVYSNVRTSMCGPQGMVTPLADIYRGWRMRTFVEEAGLFCSVDNEFEILIENSCGHSVL